MPKQDNAYTKISIDLIQRIVLGILIFLLPISILPFPWDMNQKGMSIILLLCSIVILTLELIKIIWSGKFQFIKRNIDIVIFALLTSFVLTTVFSTDQNLSLFGYNYRFGPGLIVLSVTILTTYISRSFISNKKQLLFIINSILASSILTIFLSVISLFGGNILSIFPKISLLTRSGLPIIGNPSVLATYSCVSILLSVMTLQLLEEKEVGDSSWFSILAIIINAISLVIFSADSSVFFISLTFFLLWMIVQLIILGKDDKKLKEKIGTFVLPGSILFSIVLMQIPALRSFIFGDLEVISSLSLTIDSSWSLVSQSLMTSLKDAIFGRGLDSFGVVFTALKPISYTNIDLLSASNEVFTFLSNAGFLWFVIWILFGWYILNDLIKDLRNYKPNSNILITADVLLLFIYLVSFLTTYNVVLRFILFFVLTVSVIVRSFVKSEEVDSMLVRMWTMGGKKDSSTPSLSIFLTIILSIVSILLMVRIGSITLSSLYILRAENYILSESEKYTDTTPTPSEKEDFVDNLYRWYSIARNFDRNNPVNNRKLSLIAVDKIDVEFAKYEEENNEEYLNDIVKFRDEAFEYSKTAININPSIYVNYNNRSLIYLGLVNLGYTDYTRDALSVLEDSIRLKPLDYQSYYYMAQLYYLLEDYQRSLDYSTQALTINGSYVPALLINANIYDIQGKDEIQLSYLEAIKTILETNSSQDTDLYKSVVEQIGELDIEEVISEDNDIEENLETEQLQ